MEDHILQNKTVVELRALARQSGVKLPAGTNKARIIELLTAAEMQQRVDASRPQLPPALGSPSRTYDGLRLEGK